MRSKNYIVGTLLFATGIAIIVFLGRSLLQDRAHKETLNGNCKIDQDFVTAVLIDDTDPITIERDEAEEYIVKLAKETPRYSRFVFYKLSKAFSENGKKPVSELETCNPFGQNDIADFLKEDKAALERERSNFLNNIKKITQNLLNVETKDFSQIMEGIHSVAVAEFFHLKNDAKRHLVIVSDMLQHTEGFNMYKERQEFEQFKRRPYYRRLKTKALENARVSVFELVRETKAQNENTVRFWDGYFRDQKAEPEFVR